MLTLKPFTMISRYLPVLVITAALFTIISCKKDSEAEITSSFSWTYESVSYSARIDTAYSSPPIYSPIAPVIIATRNTTLNGPVADLAIYIASLNTGSYSFSATGANIVHFVDPLGFDHYVASGSLNITSNNSSRLAGNFSFLLENGKPLTGSFTNLPLR